MTEKMNGLFILIFGIIILSTAGPVIKLCDESPLKVAFYRLFFGFLFFLMFSFGRKSNKKDGVAMNGIDMIVLFICGISLGLHFLLWIQAFSYTSVAGGVIPILIQPVLVSFLSIIFYKESLSKAMLIPLVITAFGIIFMSVGDFKTNTHLGIGDLYSSLGIVMICFYLVGVKRLLVKINPVHLNILLYIIAMTVLLIPFFLTSQTFGIGSARDFFLIFWLGGACSFLGYLSVNVALKHFKAPEVSFAIVGEPILSILWAWLFLKEVMNTNQWVGFAFGLSGFIIFVSLLKRERQIVQQ